MFQRFIRPGRTARLLVLALLPLLSSCVPSMLEVHLAKAARLTFVSLVPSSHEGKYELGFTSDVELDTLFAGNDDEKQRLPVIGRGMMCSLVGNANFKLGDDYTTRKPFIVNGAEKITKSAPAVPGQPFSYVAEVYLRVSLDGSSTWDLSASEVATALGQAASIPCKAYITVYFAGTYYSKPMQLSSAAILSAMAARSTRPGSAAAPEATAVMSQALQSCRFRAWSIRDEPALLSGVVVKLRDETPADGGVVLELLKADGQSVRASTPGLNTEPPPTAARQITVRAAAQARPGDCVRLGGGWVTGEFRIETFGNFDRP